MVTLRTYDIIEIHSPKIRQYFLYFAGLQNSVSPNLSPVDMASLAAAMRMGNNGDMSGSAQGSAGSQQQGVQATGPEQALRMHQAEALLRSQAEAALRLAVSNASLTNYHILLR